MFNRCRSRSWLTIILVIAILLTGAGTPTPPVQAETAPLPGSSSSPSLLDGSARMLQGYLSDVIESDSDLLAYFSPPGKMFSLTQQHTDIRIVKKDGDKQGKQHYLLQQHYKGLPVYGMYITAHVGIDRHLYAVTNDTAPEVEQLALDPEPALDPEQAIAAFKASVEAAIGQAISFGGSIGARSLGEPKAELLVYPQDNTYHLAYRIDMEYVSPVHGRWIGFVDAKTGDVLKKFSRLERAAPEGSMQGWGDSYYGLDRVINISRIDGRYYLLDRSKPMFRSEFGSEEGVIATYDYEDPFLPISWYTMIFDDPEAVDAHYFAGQVYDFYYSRFNRDSLDGQGMSIISVVNGGPINNAYWDGYEVIYGDGTTTAECLVCANDVVAHEFTHAVTEHSANLEYVGQSGALNEAFSDIMAAVFDAGDWTIGEDMGITEGYRVMRDLQYPERGLTPQPSTMAEYADLPEDEENDNGGVHINSGIPNHAAYLIAQGIDALPGLEGEGRKLLGQIAYGALTNYLTPTSGFVEARDAFVLAAGDLEATDESKAAILQIVKDAWKTVGLPYTSNENDIISFTVPGMEGAAVIDRLAHTVTFNVAFGSQLSELIPSIGVSPGAVLGSGTEQPQDFSVPVVYMVTSQSGDVQEWTIQGSASDPESLNEILRFHTEVQIGDSIIDAIGHTVTIYAEDMDDVSGILPEIEVSAGASVAPASKEAVNLEEPVIYSVTAQDGTVQEWTVTVIKDSASPKLLGAVALRSNVVALVFDRNMKLSTLGSASNYKFTSLLSEYSDPQTAKVEVDCDDPGIVYLTTTSALAPQNGYEVTVSNLKSEEGESVRPDTRSAYFLTEDTVAPVLHTVRVSDDGRLVALTFNEKVDRAYSGNIQITVNGEPVQFQGVTDAGRRIIVTLQNAVKKTDEVAFTHITDTYMGPISDLSGNALPALRNVPAINRSNIYGVQAAEGWARLDSAMAKQIIKHPEKPLIYAIGDTSLKVVSANLETGAVDIEYTEQFPERLYLSQGNIYAAMLDHPHSSVRYIEAQSGSIMVMDADTLTPIDRFPVNIDPFDLVIDANGLVHVTSGSGQWTKIFSYSPVTKEKIDEASIRHQSYAAYSSSKNKVYTITTDVSPRDISAYSIDSEGRYASDFGGISSPYHGDYPMSKLLRASPDGEYLFNGAGTIFKASEVNSEDMVFVKRIEDFADIAFAPDGQWFYTLKGNVLSRYSYPAMTLDKRFALPQAAAGIFPGNGPDELYVSYYSNEDITVMAYSLVAGKQEAAKLRSFSGQSLTSNNEPPINACPVSSGGGGWTPPPPPGGGGGVFFPPPVIVVPEVPEEDPAAETDPALTLGGDDMRVEKQFNDFLDKSTTIVWPDSAKLDQAIQRAGESYHQLESDDPKKANVPKVVIPVEDLADEAVVHVPASSFSKANREIPNAVIVVQTDLAAYEVPVKLIGAGVSGNVRISIEIAGATASGRIREQMSAGGFTPVSSSIDFKIMASVNGVAKEQSDFGGTYVTKSIMITGTYDANKLSALVYDPDKRQSSFVPAIVRTEGDRTIIDIKTPHNSIYTVVEASKTFTDITGHWAKEDIELMASKKVVLGITETEFQPEKPVTRAEFAALLVRALGLATPQLHADSIRFSDVKFSDWHAGVVSAAVHTQLISGYKNGTFVPGGIITRQEMAAMVGRAVRFVRGADPFAAGGQSSLDVNLNQFADARSIAPWAKDDIKHLLDAEIMEPGPDGKFEPTLPVTRAHAVVTLKRMLQLLQFIN